ncbi:hypothetical protein N7468_003763 [Penicillium chermesinum]|uniref:Uncharacterized protein n=1 Tax=Penicillium chermesinum TaxID=63820 RepID=A0A9W9P7A6_9EURO|nr:uncharacterized protein N7468_003763 [Penicillium chermesinum]KAJ5239144.1 hypothetical protein N7468_003763 [Penicillium chermesinum]
MGICEDIGMEVVMDDVRNVPERAGVHIIQLCRITLEQCIKVVFQGRYQLPPAGHKLSDEHVYMVTKMLSAKARCARKWTEDFNTTGDIKAERVPLDPSPLFYAFGVPCRALYRGYYILGGFQALRSYGTLANVKNNATIKTAQKDWLIGPVLASMDFVNTQRNLIRIYHDGKAQEVTTRLNIRGEFYETDKLLPSERDTQACKARVDRVTTRIFDLCLLPDKGKPAFKRLIDQPTFHTKVSATRQGQPDTKLLKELNPALRNLIDELEVARATTPAGDYKTQFPTLAKNLDIAANIRMDMLAVDGRYDDALAAWKNIQDKLHTLAAIAKPVHDNLVMLANLKAKYGSPAEIDQSLYKPDYLNKTKGIDRQGETLGCECYPGEPHSSFKGSASANRVTKPRSRQQ